MLVPRRVKGAPGMPGGGNPPGKADRLRREYQADSPPGKEARPLMATELALIVVPIVIFIIALGWLTLIGRR